MHCFRGNREAFADVIEAGGRSVLRQKLLDADVNVKQVTHRVLVLDAVQAAQHNITTRVVRARNGCRDLGQNIRSGFGGQLLVLNAAVLAQALWKRWENGLVALAGTAGAMGVWLALHHVSSAVVATTVFGWALAALLVAYAVAVFVTKRGEPFVAGAVYLGAVAAMGALVFVTCESIAYVHAFHVQMLVLSAGVAALILWRRWPGVLPVAAVALAVTVWVWLAMHFEPSAAMATCVYIWGLLAVLAGSILTYPWEARHRWHLHTMAAVVPMVLFGWIAMWRGLPLHAAAAQSLALVTGTLLLCARFRWNWLRGELLACSTVALTLLWVNWFWSGEMGVWTLPVWIWAFYAVVLADVLARAWLRRLETNEKLDATLSALATGLMFAATCQLLRGTYVDWLGTYTAVLGVGAVALAWIVRRRADRRVLGYAFLGQGLVLLALAAPIQWDRSLVAIAWGAQGVVAMFLARRLGNRMLLLKSPVVLTLAIVRFLIDLSQGQGGLADTILSVGGTDLSHALLLATGLAAAILVAVAILRMGPPVMSGHDRDERIGGAVMVIVALTLFGGVAALELPAVAATWWWLVAAAGVAGVAVWRRSHLLAAIAAVSLSLTALKWAGFDTLICRLMFGADLGRMTVVNWQLGAGLALAAVMLLFLTKLASRGVELAKMLSGVVAVAAGLLVIWGGQLRGRPLLRRPAAGGGLGRPRQGRPDGLLHLVGRLRHRIAHRRLRPVPRIRAVPGHRRLRRHAGQGADRGHAGRRGRLPHPLVPGARCAPARRVVAVLPTHHRPRRRPRRGGVDACGVTSPSSVDRRPVSGKLGVGLSASGARRRTRGRRSSPSSHTGPCGDRRAEPC